ncbi:hypothetical protein [Oerskovia sp. KBS0722]|uniref:hypothetical protein n=1 Tax=Oerskovia sp. KBS0722 TaxID=1179673 RepID=UPI00110D4CDD|nr:hypothetical protein [Oerskovia sp. KBS0722]QDW62329.1 hypothetical protein FFI11_007095 [Oerskovia sp. KBS0722]
MTDDFSTRLRELVDKALPEAPIDPHLALDVARRRAGRTRSRRVAASLAVAAVVAAAAVTVPDLVAPRPRETLLMPATSIATTSPEPAESATEEPVRAIVDEDAGTITTPLDGWFVSAEERAEMDTARDVFVARCMTAAGYEDLVQLVGPVPAEKTFDGAGFGLWRHGLLATDGYTQEPVESPNRFRARVEDAAAIEQQRSCFGQVNEAGLSYDPGQFEAVAPTGVTPATSTPEGIGVIDEWKQCLSERGVEPPGPDEGMVPPGVRAASPDEVTRIGEIDLACKDELGTVQRLADIQAAQESEYITRARDYLELRRPVEQAALEASRAYLQEQGLSMDPATW